MYSISIARKVCATCWWWRAELPPRPRDDPAASSSRPLPLPRQIAQGEPDVLVSAMTRLCDFSRTLTGDDFEAMRRRLKFSNAFKDEEGFILRF